MYFLRYTFRVSKKEARNQCQSNSNITRSQHQPQGTNIVINPGKPEFSSRNSGLSVNIMNERSSILNNPAATLGRTSFAVHSMPNQQARIGANNNYADPHFRENLPITVNCHPNMAEKTTGFTKSIYHWMPLQMPPSLSH